jgi:hypothetical protein
MASDRDDYDPLTCDHPLHKGHPIEVHKSIILLAKLKGLIDEIDIPDVQNARCETCANCPACKLSAREKTKSLQEEFEQDVIKKSIEIDPAHGIVFANLPFLRDPVEYLTKKHGGNNNRYQAAQIYQAQCKKPEFVKEGVRKAQADLVAKDFMRPLSSFSLAEQEAILKAPFLHFMPWRAVHKESSVSTPVRLVVDPTCTGLNEILAKGTNMLPLIPEILIQFRSYRYAWNSDVSKMYNQLHLKPASLPYSLFLFHPDLIKNGTIPVH